VMIHSRNLAQHFWGEAVNTACHIINRVYLRPETNKTPYEIWRGKKPTVKYFKTFGSKCYILGYSTNSRAYKIFNKRTETVMESINVVVDDEEDERPSSSEESQLNTVEPALTDCTKSSPNMSLEKSPSPTASDTTSSTSEDEDISANQPKQAWVKHNPPPQTPQNCK